MKRWLRDVKNDWFSVNWATLERALILPNVWPGAAPTEFTVQLLRPLENPPLRMGDSGSGSAEEESWTAWLPPATKISKRPSPFKSCAWIALRSGTKLV